MIKSFANKQTENLHHGIHTHGIRIHIKSSDQIKKAEHTLDLLNSVDSLDTLKQIPLFSDEAAVRDGHGKYSIPIDKEWRLRFAWKHGDAEEVEMVSNS